MAQHGHKWVGKVTSGMSRGGLHRALGVPEGQKIPVARVEAATHSTNKHTAAEARLALVLEHMHHGGKK